MFGGTFNIVLELKYILLLGLYSGEEGKWKGDDIKYQTMLRLDNTLKEEPEHYRRLKDNRKYTEQEKEVKEVIRKFRDFVGKFLYILLRKLNYTNVQTLSDDLKYCDQRKIKNKIESQLGFVKMKANELKQLSDFRLSSKDYSHGEKNQSAHDAQVILSNMNFRKDMQYLKVPLNKVLMALQAMDNEHINI
ncbi:hypothetical protein RCL_jg22444.t1 [Rhizophagus clarus]|uniref:Uncharacterized protein n=1 Tax=Rhizophagus clarus TaxID=94130 RepID=A0A8H3R4V1_9GLOM|nr:hypothetical protein RCL_jg22444.t1 [Rhizophagus clarus]